MNDGAIARWLEQKRRSDRAWASVISVLALGCGATVFLLTNVAIYTLVDIVSGAYFDSGFFSGLVALGVTSWSYARIMRTRRHPSDLEMDAMGWWVLKCLRNSGAVTAGLVGGNQDGVPETGESLPSGFVRGEGRTSQSSGREVD